MATKPEAALNLRRLNMNLYSPNNDNTFGGETNLSSQSRQEAQHAHEASLSSLDNDENNDDCDSDTPSMTGAHTSQSSSASTTTSTIVVEAKSSSWRTTDNRDPQKISLEMVEPTILAASPISTGDNQHKSSKPRKRSNSDELIQSTRRTKTIGEESIDFSTCSTLLASDSNHSEATVGRRNCTAPQTTAAAAAAATTTKDNSSHDDDDEGNKSSTGITMNGVLDEDDKPTQAQHQQVPSSVLDDGQQHSNRKIKKSNSVRFRNLQEDNSKFDVSIREEEIEVEPSSNGEEHSEVSEGSMCFPGDPIKGSTHNNDEEDDDGSIELNDICNDSSSEAGSIDILEASQPMLDSSMHHANKNKNPINLMNVSPSYRMKCQNTVHKVRLICGKIINHKYVQIFIVVLIIVNALMMGLATFDFVYTNPSVKSAFNKVDLAFLVVFTIESTMQLIYHGLALFKDGWLAFDFAIVILSWCFASLQVFRTMRMLRLIARIPILRRLCQALMEAVPRLSGILCLFLLIMYIYAVMVTVLFGDLYERGVTDRDYFSRLDITLFTLFQMITLDWAKIVREVMAVYPMSVLVFTTYLSFTSFVLFSLIIGVVCDAVSVTEHDADLVEALERKEDAQERILRLQQRVNYLQKQQKSVLASVQTVLDEIRVDNDPYVPGQVRAINASSGLRSSNKSKRSSGKSTTSKRSSGKSTASAAPVRSSTKSTALRSSATSAASLRVAAPIEMSSSSEGGNDTDSFCGE